VRYPPLAEVPRNEAEVDIPGYDFTIQQLIAVVLAREFGAFLKLVLVDAPADVAGDANV